MALRTRINLIILFLLMVLLAACGNNDKEIVLSGTENVTPDPANSQSVSETNAVRVGVLTKRSAVVANKQWGPLMDYLSAELNRPFVLVPVSQDDPFTAVEAKTVDFIYANSLVTVQLHRMFGTEILATTSRPELGTQFAGLIITRKDSGIETLEALRGKRGAAVKFYSAAGGYAFQTRLLLENGINPHEDFTSFVEAKTQDNVVLAVLNDSVDVGLIRTGQLENMVEEGTISSIDEFNIIRLVEDDFPLPHSTILYPEWGWSALAHTDPELVQNVQEALINIPLNHEVLQIGGVEDIVPAVDYTPIEELIQELKLPSWDS